MEFFPHINTVEAVEKLLLHYLSLENRQFLKESFSELTEDPLLLEKDSKTERYKRFDFDQAKLLPISFHRQLHLNTFEFTFNYLIDNHVDLTVFGLFRNTEFVLAFEAGADHKKGFIYR